MALSSTTTTTICINPSKNIPTTQSPKLGFSTTNLFAVKQPRRLCIRRSSSDGTTNTEVDSESSIEVPKESSSSLISILNVERALRGIPITDVDHYGRLGIPRGCPYDMVTVAYDNKVRELESQGLEEDQLKKKLELLKESYTILSSEDERRMYDWSLARTDNKYVWPFEVDVSVLQTGDPPPQEPEDVGPTRLVGYFLVGWIVLAIVLSISLNL